MKAITRAINNAFEKKRARNWDTVYWLVDVHDTIIKSTYDVNEEFAETYPYAIQALRSICLREDCKLILWTSSKKGYVESFREWMSDQGVEFTYFNENPECENTETGDFTDKFYFNIIIDDKAGFNPEEEWWTVLNNLNAELQD
jgi:hypothetical protein